MADSLHLFERLRKVSHFKTLPPAAIRQIISAGQIFRYSAGSTIYLEGGTCAGLYVLLSGQVHLCKLGIQGQESILSVIRPVIMFNEVAVLDEGSNPVTAVAILNSLTWRIRHDEFHTLMKKYPILGTSLLRVLAKRSRELMANYEDVFSRPVQARTAKVLLDLSKNGKKSICRHRHQNPELAALAATVPEAVSRHLGIFKETGTIDCSRARIIIKHPKHLAQVAMVEEYSYLN